MASRRASANRFRELGENIVIVFSGQTEMQPGGRRAGRRIRLNYDDVRDIRAECYLVRTRGGRVARRRERGEPVQQRDIRRPGRGAGRTPTSATSRWTAAASWWRTMSATAPAWRCLATTCASSCSATAPSLPAPRSRSTGLPYRIIGLTPPKTQNSSYNGWMPTRSSCPTRPWCATCRSPTRTSIRAL